MIKKLFLATALLLTTTTFTFADQFKWVSLKTAKDAVSVIKRNPNLVQYCSLCDQQKVEVVEVKEALVTYQQDNFYSVAIIGKKIYQSNDLIDSGRYSEPIQYSKVTAENPDNLWFVEEIDLAYAYIPSNNGSFVNLGKYMNLSPSLEVETINLPMFLDEKKKVYVKDVATLNIWLKNKKNLRPTLDSEYKADLKYFLGDENITNPSPFYASGDFNGDGKRDFAALLSKINQKGKNTKTLVIFNNADSIGKKPKPSYVVKDIYENYILIKRDKDFFLAVNESDDGYFITPNKNSYKLKPLAGID